MFGIHNTFWVPMSALNFSGSASIWLQYVQKKLSDYDWESFSALLCARFDRDRHQLLIRQFYTMRQSSTVADYIEKFELIINHLSSYLDTIHPFLFLDPFCRGTAAGHQGNHFGAEATRPRHCVRAGATLGGSSRWRIWWYPSSTRPRPPELLVRTSVALPLPPPPRLPPVAPATDHRGMDAARAETAKLKTPRDYCRTRGLCFK